MKRRRWVLVIALILGVIIFGGYFTWKITKADQKIKIALLKKVQPFLTEESDIEKLSISLNSISLRGVKLAPKNRNFYVNIEEVRLGYNLFNLLKYRFALHKLPHQIVLVHPIFTIEKFHLTGKDLFDNGKELNYKKVVKEFNRVKRVAVSDAEFFVQDSLGKRKRFANSLNGWLYSDPADSTVIILSGNLFGVRGSDNLKIEGKVNLLTGKYDFVHFYIKKSDLASSDVPFFLPEYLQVNGGKVSGEFKMRSGAENSGYFALKEGSFSFKNFNFQLNDVNFNTSINDTSVLIDGSVGDFCNTSLNISGLVENVFNLNVDLQAQCSDIDFNTLNKSIFPQRNIPVEGKGGFSFHVQGPVNNPEIKGSLHSSDLNTAGIDFPDFNMNVKVKEKILSFKGVSHDSTKLDLVSTGTVDMSDTVMVSDVSINIQGDFSYLLPDNIKKRLKTSKGELNIWLKGELRNVTGGGESRVLLVNNNLNRDVYISDFSYNREKLNVITTSSKNQYKLSGEIQSPFKDNMGWKLRINRVEYPLLFLLSDKYQIAADSFFVNTHLSGDSDSWTGEVIGRKLTKKDTVEAFKLFPSYREKKKSKGFICSGYFKDDNYNQLDVELTADLTDDYFKINNFYFKDDIFITGEYPLHMDNDLTGVIKLEDFNIDHIHQLFPGIRDFKGQLNGDITITGKKDSLEVTSAISINDGVFHTIGGINGDLELKINDKNVELCSISLNKNGKSWLQGSIESTNEDSLKGRLFSHWDEEEGLLHAFAGIDYIKGKGDAEFTVGGTSKSPCINSVFTIRDGTVKDVDFKELHIEIIDTLWKKFDFTKGNLRIVKGNWYKSDELNALFWGVVPHGDERDTDVSVLIEGNLFSILSEFNKDVKNTESKGELFLRLGKNEGDWFIGSGRLEINNGELSYLSPFKKVSDLNIQAEIVKGEHFVNITDFNMKVDKSEVEIKNQPVAENDDVEPFILEKYKLSLGKLFIKTGSKGLELHIPGLMEKAEKCWIDFKGTDSQDDYFTLAGPAENPLFRGTLVLWNYRFTYPFLKSNSNGGGQSAFENIFWDVHLFPKEDVHYIRSIKTPLANFEINLKLQDEFGGIYLHGCVEKDNLQVWGKLVSVEGVIDVLGHYFRPERITFDYPKGADEPIISGKAYTTVVDSLGMRSTVWLAINTAEQTNGFAAVDEPWSHTQFRFYTNDPNVTRTNTEVLSLLESTEKGLRGHAYEALGLQLENYILGPIIKPVEREIRRSFGLDLFHFSYMFGRNFFRPGSRDQRFIDTNSLIQRTKLTVGKYLGPNIFLTYSGQIQSGLLVYPDYGISFKHSLFLEYMIHSDLFLQMEYTYDSLLLSDRQVDKRIWIRHVFPF